MASFFDYHLYGLNVRSELALWGLPAARFEAPDVRLRCGPVQTPRPVRSGCFYADAERILVGREGVAVAEARGGTDLLVEPLSSADDPMLATVVLGQALAAVLHQRGVFTLHASAVLLRGGVVAFLGAGGAGKSTTAAALQRRGHALFTDDLLALEAEAPPILARPGPTLLKLRPDAADAWHDKRPRTRDLPTADLQPVGKRLWQVAAEAPPPAPLRALFVLAFGERLRLDKAAPQRAFTVVTRNAFTSAIAQATDQTVPFFQRHAAVASAIPIYVLTRPRALGGLEAMAALIEDAVAS